MKTYLKIITMPIWLPFKIVWFFSKVLAFTVIILLLAALIFILMHI